MAPAVHLRKAVALLGQFPALAGVDLDVDAGEIVLVRGPNGAGKTTLLRACAGLVPVRADAAEVLGVDLRVDRRAIRRRVGLLGHHDGLYDDLTVRENLHFWARATGSTAEVDDVLSGLGLDGRVATTAVAGLSAGQRRRTALARVAVQRPGLWLLDEPHSSLDAAHRDVLDDMLRAAAAEGAAVVVASHEDERAGRLAHRAVTIVGGQTVEEPAHVA